MYRLSIPRLVGSDYVAFSVVLYPVVLWLIGLILAAIDCAKAGWVWSLSTTTLSLVYIAVLITLVCLPMLAWRFYKLNDILKDGIEASGKIKSISFSRDRGIVAYTYPFQGKTYHTRATIHKTRLTRSLLPGSKTILIVSKSDPRRAFIRDLYTLRSNR